MMLCAAKMLNHVNLRFYGDMLRNAIDKVLKGGKVILIAIFGFSVFFSTVLYCDTEPQISCCFMFCVFSLGSHQRLGWTSYHQRIYIRCYQQSTLINQLNGRT
jgi:hypothetical protein